MEREILFRGKAVNSGQWIESMTISKGTIERKRHNLFMEVSEKKWKGIIPETLGQFSGLYDKIKSRIFENDILKSGSHYLICKFHNGSFCFYTLKGNMVSPVDTSEYEVVGNTYDNPELLDIKY